VLNGSSLLNHEGTGLKLMKTIFRHWKIIYVVCALAFMSWVLHVGTNEFDRINSQYRRLGAQLDAGRIKSGALEELTSECRRKSGGSAGLEEHACLSFPPQALEAREKAITEHRKRAKEKGTIKLVLFYTGFVVIFLLAPPALIYLLLAGVIALYKNIKFVR
jgi:hypothetical protein